MKSKKPISVLVVRVGQEPVLCYLPPDPSLETLQELVGGGICGPSIGFGLSVYANGDGLRLRLPYNRCGLVGDFFVMKDSSAGNPIAMTDKDIARAKDWLARNYHRPPYCHVCGSPGGATLFCPCRDVLIFCCGCYDKLAEVMNGSDLGEQKRFGLCPRCRERN